ncbi:MAG: DUF177 domain-containing protein [Firmicutes bacterium]|nr:DUF177 domain-containing protein [Bacillota bacterium]
MIISWTRAQSQGGYDLAQEVVIAHGQPSRPTDPLIDPVQVRVHAQVEGEQCIVQGELITRVTQPCIRCLTDVFETSHIPFREVFSRTSLTREQEESDVVQVQGEEFSLTPLVEQAIYLSIHPQPLCDANCKGLCPHCGVNRNDTICSCDQQVTDPRLDALAAFFEDQDD